MKSIAGAPVPPWPAPAISESIHSRTRLGQLQPGVDLREPIELAPAAARPVPAGPAMNRASSSMRGVSVRLMISISATIATPYTSRIARVRRMPSPDEPTDRRLEQVDEQQADDERADGIAGHPEQDPDDHRRGDEDRDARRERGEAGLGGDAGRIDEGRWRQGRDPGRRTADAGVGFGFALPSGRAHGLRGTVRARPSSGRLPDVSEPPVRAGRATPALAPRGRARRGRAEQPQRELAEGWVAAIEAAGLPVAWTEGARSRPRIAFGAPLPIGMAANAELIDVVMTERWPAWRVREALDGPACRPAGAWSTSRTCGSPARRSPAGSPRPTIGSSWPGPCRWTGSGRAPTELLADREPAAQPCRGR